ncbi:hypothetical protein MAQ5080_01687 [Marinomonas aquimarina]|uniref:Uncharacterized protein n=2 Tax=Marinomonas aquimarina TaxID=295068 RepID=A0A1A8TBX5_9GAMM|nr:hypothetical protein MAQ5080_01687 [Marinomonas aquimarina]
MRTMLSFLNLSSLISTLELTVITMSLLKRTLFATSKRNEDLSYGGLYWLAALLALICTVCFAEELMSLLTLHVENYFKAQQALVDAKYFAC